MTLLQAMILGLIQGVTEFLPISSSGHLHLAEYFLGLDNLDRYVLFDLACHLGTLLAIVCVFATKIRSLFTTEKTRLYQLGIALLPLFPLVALLKPIKTFYADPAFLGIFFMCTAFILFLGIRFGKIASAEQKQHSRWRDALSIGLWQTAAIFPGVSRSGSTISGARLLGWTPIEAVTFSFLLAIPTILGAVSLELINLWRHPENVADISGAAYLIAFFISFGIGAMALKLFMYLAARNQFSCFAWYCLFLGLAVSFYFYY